jgi:hypothetical protein
VSDQDYTGNVDWSPDYESDDPSWDEVYEYVDEQGVEYTAEQVQQMIDAGEGQIVEPGLAHPDEPLADFGGATLRDLWNTLPDNDRRAAREKYAVERYKELKTR